MVRAVVMATGSIVALIAYIVVRPFGVRARVAVSSALGVFYCRVGGIDIAVHGVPDRRRPVLYVSNHMSYLDIVVIGTIVPANFVAKTQVVDWPMIGMMARLNDTLLIDRQVRGMRAQCAMLRGRLEAGNSLILFPEGTSSGGNRMRPFRSSLFDVADAAYDNAPVRVQPVSVAYTRLNGCPVTRWQRPFFAWYGQMPLAGHLWRSLGLGRVGVDIIFHEPVRLEDFPSRKALASHCEQQVSWGVAIARAGHLDHLPPPGTPFVPDQAGSASGA